MSDTIRTGGCLCGAVRYEVAAEPMMAGRCYCSNCQKLSGAGHQFSVALPASTVRAMGETRGYDWRAESGNLVTTYFCPTCGCPMFGKSSGMPGIISVRVASFDDPSAFAPQISIFAKRRQPWDCLDPALPQFPGMPPLPQP